MVGPDKVRAIREKAEALAGRPLGQSGDLLAELAAQRALAHCQREDIPEGMEQAVAALALSLEEGGGTVKAIQRGDTAVTYDTGSAGYWPLAALAPWRRLGRVKEDAE